MAIKPLIFGINSTQLQSEEKKLLQEHNPLGIILFSRNINDPQQLAELTADIRRVLGRDDAPIFLDQEGGRVARLKEPHWIKPAAAADFGKIAETNMTLAKEAAYINGRLIGHDMLAVGCNIDCAPVLDVPALGAHSVIGNRAFSNDKHIICNLAAEFSRGLMEAGVVPIIKHIPGHGRGMADSHLELPVVDADYTTLQDNDFYPFKQLNYLPMAMTAHIVYKAIDPYNPATTSAKLIKEIIRDEIGFGGLLVSDCITMQALSGSKAERAENSFAAGVDLVIFSRGSIEEFEAVSSVAPDITGEQLKLLEEAYACTRVLSSEQEEVKGLRNRLSEILGGVIEVAENGFDHTEQLQ